MQRVERIYKTMLKHQGRQVDENRIEVDLSMMLELFSLEDYIQELERKISNLEVEMVGLKNYKMLKEWENEAKIQLKKASKEKKTKKEQK